MANINVSLLEEGIWVFYQFRENRMHDCMNGFHLGGDSHPLWEYLWWLNILSSLLSFLWNNETVLEGAEEMVQQEKALTALSED